MKNKVYLVSQVEVFEMDTMYTSFKLFNDINIAKAYFDTLVNDFKINALERYECEIDELSDYLYDIHEDKYFFSAIADSDITEIKTELKEMEIY